MSLLANIAVVLLVIGSAGLTVGVFIAAEVSRGKIGLATMRRVGLPLSLGGAVLLIVAAILALLQKGS